jgi:flagellar protein FliL
MSAEARKNVRAEDKKDLPAEGKTENAPGKWRKKLVVLTAGLLLVGGSAGSAWYVAQQRNPQPARADHYQKLPLFTTLDPFTVNLQDPYSERVAQIGITLQFDDPAVEVSIKDRLPAVRNGILLLISSKRVDELITTEGKQLLAQQIRDRSAQALGFEIPEGGTAAAAKPGPDNPIRAVLFSQFLVQ